LNVIFDPIFLPLARILATPIIDHELVPPSTRDKNMVPDDYCSKWLTPKLAESCSICYDFDIPSTLNEQDYKAILVSKSEKCPDNKWIKVRIHINKTKEII
jgi:hypothetical protein